MYDDVKADFWKEIFVHMQHRNMSRIDAEKLTLANVKSEFENFCGLHPELKTVSEINQSFAALEIEIESESEKYSAQNNQMKIRLFVQSQIKCSLMEKAGGDYVKVCDAKFPNNPFPEIEEFIRHKDEYLNQVSEKEKNSLTVSMKQKVAGEFLKAQAKIRYPDFNWKIENVKDGFIFYIDERQTFISLETAIYSFSTCGIV